MNSKSKKLKLNQIIIYYISNKGKAYLENINYSGHD